MNEKTMNGTIKYAIIGNSTAAVAAAETIRSIDSTGTIAMISDEPYHTYSRPLISYYLYGRVSEEGMKYRDSDFYEKNGIIPVLGRKVTGVDTDGKRILFGPADDDTGNAGGNVYSAADMRFEKLLIATGSRPAIPPIKGVRRNNVFNFIKFDDARQIERYASKGSKAVIIGASFSGLKAVECLAERGVSVTAVDIADRLMPRMLDEASSRIVEHALAKRDINVYLGSSVISIGPDNDEGADAASVAIRTPEGETKVLPCDFVIVATGVAANTDLVKNTPIKINRGIIANDRMETSVQDIYTAGDVSEIYDPLTDTFTVIPTLPSAFEQGETAGSNMAGIDKVYKSSPLINSMPLFDMTVMGAGFTIPGEDAEQIVRHKTNDRKIESYMKFIIIKNRLVGYILVNEPNRAGLYTDLIRNGIDVSPFKENLTNDEFGFLSMPPAVRQSMLYAGIET